jgi:hypothetical protein
MLPWTQSIAAQALNVAFQDQIVKVRWLEGHERRLDSSGIGAGRGGGIRGGRRRKRDQIQDALEDQSFSVFLGLDPMGMMKGNSQVPRICLFA